MRPSRDAHTPVEKTGAAGFPVQMLWKTALQTFRASHLSDLRVGRYSMRGVHRYVVRHCVWPYYKRLARGEISVHGLRMYVPEDPDSLGFVMGTFEAQTCALFESLVKEGMAVVDAGANIGFYSLLAARKAGPMGKVYAFEPEPSNFALLKKNVELNGYANVRSFLEALSESSRRVPLYLSHKGCGSHSLYQDRAVGNDCIEVQAVSFDDFWEAEGRPRVGLIKMDIEGSEPYAIEGMRRFLASVRELAMIVEYFPGGLLASGTKPDSFMDRLHLLGFQIHVLLGTKSVPLVSVDMRALHRRLGEEFGVNLLCART